MTGDATEGNNNNNNNNNDDDDTAGETEAADSTGADDPTGGTGQTGDTGMATSADSTSSMGMTGETSDSGSAGACVGMPLDAALEVPPLCAPTCDAIGFGSDCPAIEICRLKDSQTAVCESCEPCGNLHDPCTASSQCDILLTCYLGQCTAMCDFATPQTCGNPAACTNVGHPTHGVCDPNL